MKLTQLSEMLALQDKLNCRVDVHWRIRGNSWTRAIVAEAAEAMDHYGWKWWKKQTPDLPQVRLELVDIWHFMLSFALENAANPLEECAEAVAASAKHHEMLMQRSVLQNLEHLIARAAGGEIVISVFVALMAQTGLTWDMLYETYIGKNVLNMFRQDHGYKTGTYIKDWDGVEDNVVLAGLIDIAGSEEGGVNADKLYSQLEGVYRLIPRLRAVA